MDRDPLPERDVADDLVNRYRRAALREPDEHVLDADDVDAVRVAREGIPCLRLLPRDRLLLGDLLDLQALQHLVHDAARSELAGAERDVEVLRLLEARLPDHAREHRRPRELPVRQVLRLQRVLERLAPLRLQVLLLLAREELTDLVPRARR